MDDFFDDQPGQGSQSPAQSGDLNDFDFDGGKGGDSSFDAGADAFGSGGGFDAFDVAPVQDNDAEDFFNDDDTTVPPATQDNGGDELFGLAEGEQPVEPSPAESNGQTSPVGVTSPMDGGSPMSSTSSLTAPPPATISMDAPSSNTSVLLEYEREHQKYLKEKAEDAEQKHQEQLEQARKELEKFYEDRKQQTQEAKERNRAKAEALKSTMNAPSDDKSAWANVHNLVDVNAPTKGKDLSRFREVLVAMKHA